MFKTYVYLQSIGKYFKQSAKALEEKIAREARFYGALIRYALNCEKVTWCPGKSIFLLFPMLTNLFFSYL